jgi:hypothetical protein
VIRLPPQQSACQFTKNTQLRLFEAFHGNIVVVLHTFVAQEMRRIGAVAICN